MSPVVTGVMKGIFRRKPPLPKYSHTWDVPSVLNWIKQLGPNEDLSLKLLSIKTVLLLALCAPKRVSELAQLDLRFIQFSGSDLIFHIPTVTKTRRQGEKPVTASVSQFENPLLCPIQALQRYRATTDSLRNPSNHRLFISFRKPHNAVTPATLSRWILTGLSAAGIDTKAFQAHSVRGASTSHAQSRGVSLAQIFKAAHWADNSNTFVRFYLRDVSDDTSSKSFTHAILSSDKKYVASK